MRSGDLAQTYPLARGTAPLLTAARRHIALVSEIPSPISIGGIVLLSVGTFLMSFRGGGAILKSSTDARSATRWSPRSSSPATRCPTAAARGSPRPRRAMRSGCSSRDGLWSLVLALGIARPGDAVAAITSEWKTGAVDRRAQRRRLLDRHVGDDQGADRLGRGAARDLDPVRHDDLGLRASREADRMAHCGRAADRRRRDCPELG